MNKTDKTLEELLSAVDKANLCLTKEDREWLNAKPVGLEVGGSEDCLDYNRLPRTKLKPAEKNKFK